MLTLVAAAVLLASDPCADAVVEFARSKVGQKVGDGECSALASAALSQAGAKRPAGEAWGEPRASFREVRPGDILQFQDAVFVHSRFRDDGALVTLTYRYAHHTAIVANVRKRGRRPVLAILHQNAGAAGGDEQERKIVQEWVINLAELRSGTIKAYRPLPE